jgi:NADH-quinone oxidoreductase subunit A
MPAAYIPELFFALLVLLFPALTLFIIKLIGPAPIEDSATLQPDKPRVAAESSGAAESSSPGHYLSRFFVVAMLFLIFEVATIFLIPWAILFRSALLSGMGGYALMSMVVFAGILLVGYLWLYKKGALDWAQPPKF